MWELGSFDFGVSVVGSLHTLRNFPGTPTRYSSSKNSQLFPNPWAQIFTCSVRNLVPKLPEISPVKTQHAIRMLNTISLSCLTELLKLYSHADSLSVVSVRETIRMPSECERIESQAICVVTWRIVWEGPALTASETITRSVGQRRPQKVMPAAINSEL